MAKFQIPNLKPQTSNFLSGWLNFKFQTSNLKSQSLYRRFPVQVFAEDAQFADEGPYGVDRLTVACVVVVGEVDVEHIFPFLSDDGE